MNMTSKLQSAIDKALVDGHWFAVTMALAPGGLADPEDVLAICDAMRRAYELPEEKRDSNLHELVTFAYSLHGAKACQVYQAHGLPTLIAYFDDLNLRTTTEKQWDTLVHSLRVMIEADSPAALSRLLSAARRPDSQSFFWTVLFRILTNHALRDEILESLSTILPSGFAGKAFVDFANQLCLKGHCKHHPFNSKNGLQLLVSWIEDGDPKRIDYTNSAVVALAFVEGEQRNHALALALDHSHPSIQMEAAWVAGRLGRNAGVKMLANLCLRTDIGAKAMAYLKELGRGDAIPKEASEPDFAAQCELVSWLQHPNEFGRTPDAIELFDTREIQWPPTKDRRRVWLFKYTFLGKDGEEDNVGVGMVGSTTFSLWSETAVNLSAEDIYGLHCCWELQNRKDSRAPAKRSAAAGRAILAKANGWK
jgi:hypothetical protein